MVADDFIDDEAQEFFGEIGVEVGFGRQPTQPFNLQRFARRVCGGERNFRLQPPDRLRNLEPFGEHGDERGIDIIDATSVVLQHILPVHASPLSFG